jgi:sporulation protein YlmC with PRC-barrel domain
MNRLRTSGLLAAALLSASAAARAQSSGPAPQPGVAFSHSVLASEVIGMRVRTSSGERIGAVEDLVLSSGNLVSAAVVSVGGFLGLGERRVEVPYDKLLLSKDASLVVSLTREELAAMPAYSVSSYAVEPSPDGNRTDASVVPAPTAVPGAEARSEANAEAARSFATDDPRVAKGIAENKAAFDGDEVSEAVERSEP